MKFLSKRVFFFLGLIVGLGVTTAAFAEEPDCGATLKGKECGDASFGESVLTSDAYRTCCPSKLGVMATTSCKNTANQVLPSDFVFQGSGDAANTSSLITTGGN